MLNRTGLRRTQWEAVIQTITHANSRGNPFRFQAGSVLTETEAVSDACGIVPVYWLAGCRTHSALADEFECGKAAATAAMAGAGCRSAGWPASVGVETAASRHLAQSPCGALAGSGAWHFGQ